MANHKSAEKRARQSLRKNDRNSRTKKSVRTAEKKLRKAISNKSKDEAQKVLAQFIQRVDKAAQKGVLHRNNAARRVSRLSHQVNAL